MLSLPWDGDSDQRAKSKARERQAMAGRQLWHYPTKKRMFLNDSNCLGKTGVCQNIHNSTSFPKRKDLKSSAANFN